TMAILRSFGGTSFTRRSPMYISPAEMSSSPATIRNVVVLPHPEGPTNTTNSLSSISRFTLFTATTSSENFFTRLRKVTCAIEGPSSWHAARRYVGLYLLYTPLLVGVR